MGTIDSVGGGHLWRRGPELDVMQIPGRHVRTPADVFPLCNLYVLDDVLFETTYQTEKA